MKNIRIFLIVAATLIASAVSPATADNRWEVDSAHAGIYFGIDHIYSQTRGFFQSFEADIAFDPDNPAAGKFRFSVAVDSINTSDTKRDNHLLSKDFFDAGTYPKMTFESTSITPAGGNTYELKGTLTIKDVSRSVSVPFTFLGAKTHPFNAKKEVAGFEARMTVNRLDYNVGNGKFYKMGVIGKDVEVLISVEATRDK